uniref:RING-type domain-containing protein n=1 Tax=Cynoglossus semilaevis TaxID=244447 RepID=A0A3P8UK64_CYNSE
MWSRWCTRGPGGSCTPPGSSHCLAGNTETDSEDDKDREGLICPVCLDVFFRPHSCKPCGHVFCEPCLRRVAKNRARSTPCPLCRSIISYTDVNKGEPYPQTKMLSFFY